MTPDPSRPLACIPLRASCRAFLAVRHQRAAEDARAQAESNRRSAGSVSGGDEEGRAYWTALFATSAREADERAARHEAAALGWLS